MTSKASKRRAKVVARSKGGRPRSKGDRTPSGQLSRSASGYDSRGARDVATAQPHRRWLAEDKRSDQYAESVLGRLYLAGEVTERQLWAGERLRRVMADFRSVMASPITPRVAMASMIAPSLEPSADHVEAQNSRTDARTESEMERHDRVLREFDEARDALLPDAEAYAAVHAVSVDDRSSDNLAALRRGLTELVDMYGFQEDKPKKIKGEYVERPEWGRGFREVHFIYDDAHLTNGHKSGNG